MFKAKLFIFEREYEILKFKIQYNQNIDAVGMPIERVNGNFIDVEFSSIKNEREFFEVAFSNRKTVKGYVRFYRRDGFQKFYDYEFANTYIVNFNETFDAVNNKPLTTKVQFNAGIVKRDDVMFATNWNPSNPFEKQAAPTVIENENLEPIITDGYYTDLTGEKIDDYELVSGEQVYYVLHTTNAIGKYLDLDLTNTQNDFKHNGKLLVNDILEDLKVTADTQKIKLEVIRQTN